MFIHRVVMALDRPHVEMVSIESHGIFTVLPNGNTMA